ncbi:MAG: hypothetical protein ACLSFA_02670 [Roseburia inulinivorans]
MVEYSLLNILMVLFSTQVVSTYLGAFGNHKKKTTVLPWFWYGEHTSFTSTG